MPAEVDKCVKSLLSKWESDPASRPKPKPKQKDQDAKSQAWAICNSAMKRAGKLADETLAIMLADGTGPVLIGGAATNRPYIPQLQEIETIDRDGEKWFKLHLANAGFFAHPLGPFKLNRAVFSTMKQNFQDGVFGQKVAFDARHQPDVGALGWFDELFLGEDGKRLFAWVKPTEKGLEIIEDGQFKYCSMEFRRNYSRDDVVLDLEDVSEDFCLTDLAKEEANNSDDDSETTEENLEGDKMSDEDRLKLEDRLAKLEDQLEEANTLKADAEALAKKEADKAREAQEKAVQLEMETFDSKVDATIALAINHRDSDGNGHPKALIDWLATTLKFEPQGEDDKVRLSEDVVPNMGVREYLLDAAKSLIESLPGVVPSERKTESGAGDSDDKFDYGSEWEE